MALPTFPHIQSGEFIFKASATHREGIFLYLVETYPDIPETLLEHIAANIEKPLHNIKSYSLSELCSLIYADYFTSAVNRYFWIGMYSTLKQMGY